MERWPTTAKAESRQRRWVAESKFMYCLYILKSEKSGKYYTGSTDNIQERLVRHNRGKNKSTKKDIPWKLVYQEKYETRQDAYRREMKIKSYKGGGAFKKLLNLE